MGPNFWTPDKPSKLKKCSEFKVGACDTVKADGCCGVIECTFCLIFEGTDGTQYGVADFASDGWYGTIANVNFIAYWERNYTTGECEFIVTLDGIEIYRNDCYGGQSCRDSSDSAAVTIGYEDGTLFWTKKEPRPLEYIKDPDSHCTVHFCGTCECTCECMCVTISDTYGIPIANGEICDVSYPCDAPRWEGTVGEYSLSLLLGRDVYGECVITPTVDGITLDAVASVGCGDLTASFEIADGTQFTVTCKVCSCYGNCGEGCCVPWFTDPLYPNGVVDVIPFSITSDCVTLDGETGIFTPLVPTSTPRGTCGFCATYQGDWAGSVPGEFPTGLENPASPGTCLMSPCTVDICLVLECNNDESAIVGQNACCSKMRLWVGTTVPQVGDIGEIPTEPITSCQYWRKIEPTMCECDPVGGIIATFPVSVTVTCDPRVGGFCDGIADCCQVACSFDVVI